MSVATSRLRVGGRSSFHDGERWPRSRQRARAIEGLASRLDSCATQLASRPRQAALAPSVQRLAAMIESIPAGALARVNGGGLFGLVKMFQTPEPLAQLEREQPRAHRNRLVHRFF